MLALATPAPALAEAPGPDLPPQGRSLFDFLTTGEDGATDVPYPFPALLARIAGHMNAHEYFDSPLARLLIPLGRSLQRNAAAPDFFAFPRAVVAADAEGATTPGAAVLHLRHRLYLGYQEKAGLIEVISYNEGAGRFEFQVVKNYRPGATPQVYYANRQLCLSCHQNAAPIFARPLWDETNANRIISARLQAERTAFYGIPAAQSVDVAYAFDNAVDQANRLASVQRVWREACGPGAGEPAVHCRAGLLSAALQYRLSGRRHFDTHASHYRDRVLPHLDERWRALWPAGLALPDPDVPNRKPMSTALPGEVGSEVPAALEPLQPRAPLTRWELGAGGARVVHEVVAGLGDFLAADDVARLDRHLAGRSPRRQVSVAAGCEYRVPRSGGLHLRCGEPGAPLALQAQLYPGARAGLHGLVRRLSLHGQDYLDLGVTRAERESAEGGAERWTLALRQGASGLHVRDPRGYSISRLVVRLHRERAPQTGAATARVELWLADDYAPLAAALAAIADATLSGETDALADAPLRRAAVMSALFARLGLAPLDWCCLNAAGMPAPRREAGTKAVATTGDPGLARLERYCGACHRSDQAFPPNFLFGPRARVRAQVAQCAPRMAFRLAMWRQGAGVRAKAPMPPPAALAAHDLDAAAWPGHPDLDALQRYVGRLPGGRVPPAAALSTATYAGLPPCPGAPAGG